LYNYSEDRKWLEKKYKFHGHCDSEIMGMLYKEFGSDKLWEKMKGMYAAVLYDKSTEKFYIGRDHVGIIPLYFGIGQGGVVYVSSELKCIHDQVEVLFQMPPG
jgi:asparagine synthase (glutamine-hydrolysing)